MYTLAMEKAGLSRTQVIVATTLGTALEFYDFTIYSFFAIQIGQLFFPSASPVNQFLLSIGVFGVGFVVRPLGGIVIGAYADRVGRKKAMVLTIMLMALSCALIASAPTYAVAGMAAPFIVLAARLIQGFAAGGEFGPGTTLLVEYASDSTRAFFASWNFSATALGLAMGAGVATLVNVMLSKEAVLAWGWRIPFVLGIVAAPVGMLIRRRLEETLSGASSRGDLKTLCVARAMEGAFASEPDLRRPRPDLSKLAQPNPALKSIVTAPPILSSAGEHRSGMSSV